MSLIDSLVISISDHEILRRDMSGRIPPRFGVINPDATGKQSSTSENRLKSTKSINITPSPVNLTSSYDLTATIGDIRPTYYLVCIYGAGTILIKPEIRLCYTDIVVTDASTSFDEDLVSDICNETSTERYSFSIARFTTECYSSERYVTWKTYLVRWCGNKVAYIICFIGFGIFIIVRRILNVNLKDKSKKTSVRKFYNCLNTVNFAFLIWKLQESVQTDVDWRSHFPYLCYGVFIWRDLVLSITHFTLGFSTVDRFIAVVSPLVWRANFKKCKRNRYITWWWWWWWWC